MEKLSKDQIYASGQFLDGREFQIIMPKGRDISRAMRLYSFQSDRPDALDVIIFFMSELCLIEGEKKDTDFYGKLMIDDYLLICAHIGRLMTPNS